MDTSALIIFINSTGFVHASCQRTYDPPRVQIDLLFGLQLNIDYATYQQICAATGMPESVCEADAGG